MKFLVLFALIVIALVVLGIARRQSTLSDTDKDYDDPPSGPVP